MGITILPYPNIIIIIAATIITTITTPFPAGLRSPDTRTKAPSSLRVAEESSLIVRMLQAFNSSQWALQSPLFPTQTSPQNVPQWRKGPGRILSLSCYNKFPWTVQHINNRNSFLIVVEAGSLRSGCQQGWARALFLALPWSPFPASSCSRRGWKLCGNLLQGH